MTDAPLPDLGFGSMNYKAARLFRYPGRDRLNRQCKRCSARLRWYQRVIASRFFGGLVHVRCYSTR